MILDKCFSNVLLLAFLLLLAGCDLGWIGEDCNSAKRVLAARLRSLRRVGVDIVCRCQMLKVIRVSDALRDGGDRVEYTCRSEMDIV